MNALLEIPLNGEDIARKAMMTPAQKTVDKMQAVMEKMPQVEMPLTHEFAPNLYIRTILMPKGSFVISKIHKTEHPFIISRGKVAVWIEGVGVKIFTAPHRGITKAGTRRLLYMHEDTEWTTFHVTDKTDLDEIEKDVIFKPESDDVVEISETELKQLKGKHD
jgi:hypothetical protein